MKNVRIMSGFIVIKSEEVPEKTDSGIYIPKKNNIDQSIGTVVAIGSDVNNIEVDQKVIYKKWATSDKNFQEINGEKVLFIKAEDVLATYEE